MGCGSVVEPRFVPRGVAVARVPLPTVEAMRAVLEELETRNPKAKGQDPRKYFDDRFVRELQSSGFIDGLYR